MSERTVTVRLSAVDDYSPALDGYIQRMSAAAEMTAMLGAQSASTGGQMSVFTAALTGSAGETQAAPPIDTNAIAAFAEAAAAGAASLGQMRDAAPDLADGVGALRAQAEGAQAALAAAAAQIERLTSGVQEVRLRLNVEDPFGLLRLLGGGFDLAQTVRDNGGSVPGASPRSRARDTGR